MSKANKPIKEYEIKHIEISKLKFDETNPNQLIKEQEQSLEKAFKRFGYLVPIVINEQMEIGDGEHRARIYKKLGLDKIPAFIVPKINNDIERRLLRQTMNKLRGEHDIKLDATEIELIFRNDKLQDLTDLIAKDKEELEQILTKHKGIEFNHEDNFDVDKTIEELVPITKLGDIWQLGNHRIICADCSDQRSIDKLMEGKKVDVVFADPPYGVEYKGSPENEHEMLQNDNKNEKVYAEFFSSIIKIIEQIAKKNAVFYIFHSHTQQQAILNTLDKYQLQVKAMLIWVKNSAVWSGILNRMSIIHYKQQHESIYYCKRKADKTKDLSWFGGYDQSTILEFDKSLSNTEHPTMKPITLYSKLIKNNTKEKNIVFDPCLGSGSIIIACEQTNRICYGVEIDPHYVDVCVKRWEQYTGKKAVKI